MSSLFGSNHPDAKGSSSHPRRDNSTSNPEQDLLVEATAESEIDQHGNRSKQEAEEAFEDEPQPPSSLVESNVAVNEENHDIEWITMDEAMDRIGVGPFQYKILMASGLCFAADAMQIIMLSFLTVVLKEEWDLSDTEAEGITPMVFAGAFVGSLVLGPAADRVGRRPIFLLAASIISVFGLGCALASNLSVFMPCLFAVGFGIGGVVVPFDILAEFLPSEGRGKFLLTIEYFWTTGCLFVVVAAYFTLHGIEKGGKGGDHWRSFVAICTIPCWLSLLIGVCFTPESARWLSAEGKPEEAMQVMRKAAIANGYDNPDDVFPDNIQIRQELIEKTSSLSVLFTPAWIEITFRLWGTWMASSFGYYGALLAITRVFERETPQTQQDSTTYDFDYGAIFISSCAELVGTTMVIFLVDEVGRISTQIMCYMLAGLSVGALCCFSSWHYPHVLLVTLGFAARVFEMGGTCTTWVSTAEILTTEVRTTGHASANAMARIGGFLCPFLVDGDSSLAEIGIIFFFVHLFTVVCALKLPETKGRNMGAPVPTHEEPDQPFIMPQD